MAPNAIEYESSVPPIQLIRIEKDDQGREIFEIEPDAIEELQKVDTHLAVFSMCGVAGCGKSFLLNCLLKAFNDNGVSFL